MKCPAGVKYAFGVWNRCGGEGFISFHLTRSVKYHNSRSELFHRELSERFHFLLRFKTLNIGRGACRVVQKHRASRQARPSPALPVPKANASVFFNEINPCGICEMPCGREIRLRRVKSLRRCGIYFISLDAKHQISQFTKWIISHRSAARYFTFLQVSKLRKASASLL